MRLISRVSPLFLVCILEMVALAWKSVATGTAVVSAGVREDLDATLAYQRLCVSKSVSVCACVRSCVRRGRGDWGEWGFLRLRHEIPGI